MFQTPFQMIAAFSLILALLVLQFLVHQNPRHPSINFIRKAVWFLGIAFVLAWLQDLLHF
jgi:hypothetical protein